MKNFNSIINSLKLAETVSPRITEKTIFYIITKPGIDRGLTANISNHAIRKGLLPKPSENLTRPYILNQDSPKILPGNTERLSIVENTGLRMPGVFEAPISRIGEEFALACVNRNLGISNQKYVYSEYVPQRLIGSYPNLTSQMNPDGVLVVFKDGNYQVYGATDCKNHMIAGYTSNEQIILPSLPMSDNFLIKSMTHQLSNLRRNIKKIIDYSDREKIKKYIIEKENLRDSFKLGQSNQIEFLSKAIALKHQYYSVLQRNCLPEAIYVNDELVGYDKVQQDLKTDPELEEFHAMNQRDLLGNNSVYNYYRSNDTFRIAYDQDNINIPLGIYEELLRRLN